MEKYSLNLGENGRIMSVCVTALRGRNMKM